MLHGVVLIRGTLLTPPDADPLAVAPDVLYQPPCLQLPSSFACQPHGKAEGLGPRYNYPSLGFYTTPDAKACGSFRYVDEKGNWVNHFDSSFAPHGTGDSFSVDLSVHFDLLATPFRVSFAGAPLVTTLPQSFDFLSFGYFYSLCTC